jgi:hypothetical protein
MSYYHAVNEGGGETAADTGGARHSGSSSSSSSSGRPSLSSWIPVAGISTLEACSSSASFVASMVGPSVLTFRRMFFSCGTFWRKRRQGRREGVEFEEEEDEKI